jgi:hypothetical protein
MSGIEYVALVIGTIIIVVLIGIRNWRKNNR